MPLEIPPWLQVNPQAPASTFLQAYGQGASAGASARAAAQRDQELEFRQQQAEELNRIRQQEMQLKADEFGLQLRERQKKAELEAQAAAIQLEGQQAYSKDIAGGMDPIKALVKNAGKMMYNHPQALPAALKLGITAPSPTFVPANPQTGEGAHWVSGNRVTQMRQPIADAQGNVTAYDIVDQSGQPLGQKVYHGASGAVHLVKGGELTPEGRLGGLKSILASIDKELQAVSPKSPEGIDALQRRQTVVDIMSSMTGLSKGTIKAAAPIPRPANPSELKTGQAYAFPDGRIFKYTGTNPSDAKDKSKWEQVVVGKLDESQVADDSTDDGEE